MAEPVKFTFTSAFDGGLGDKRREEIAQMRADHQKALAKAKEEAFEAGRQAAKQEIEAAALTLFQQFQPALQDLLDNRQALEERLKQEKVALVETLFKKMAPSLSEHRSHREVEALIEEAFNGVTAQTSMIIEVHPELRSYVLDKVKSHQPRTDFKGNIEVIPRDDMHIQDCVIRWSDGGLEKSHEEIENQIAQALTKFILGDNMPNQATIDDETPGTTPDTASDTESGSPSKEI